MANTYKNIIITPNRDTDAANVPVIRFSGGDATTNTDINVRVYTSQSGTLSFEGSAGQLFSITNDLTNSIFSVNDVSGIPSIDVYANGDILLAPFGGQIFVGNTANLNFDSTRSTKIVEPAANTLTIHTAQTERIRFDSSGNVLIGRTTSTVGSGVKLDVAGAANASNLLVNGNMVFTAANDGSGSNLDADLLDGQQGSYYLANTAGISTAGAFIVPGVLTANAGGASFQMRAGGTADHVYIEYYPRSATGSRGAYVGYGSAATNTFSIINETTTGSLELGTQGAGDLTIDSSGNVLIGRTTSTVGSGVKLDIAGAANASNILINGNMALTTQNYNSYAPTLTGTGASGSWGISVTGSAGTFTSTVQNSQFNSLGVGTAASAVAGSIIATTYEVGATDTTISRSSAGVIAVEGVVVPTISSTNTLTNKRVTPRVVAYTSNAGTPSIDTDSTDIFVITGQTVNITSLGATGTPTNGQTLRVALTSGSGTPTIAWSASFESSTAILPTTMSTTRKDVGFVWNAATSKWRCIAVA